jgi:hypothetical protein
MAIYRIAVNSDTACFFIVSLNTLPVTLYRGGYRLYMRKCSCAQGEIKGTAGIAGGWKCLTGSYTHVFIKVSL